MASKEFVCPRCGRTHTVEADVFMPGVSGHIVDSNGKLTTFADPTEWHHCTRCVSEVLEELINAQNQEV